MVNKFYFDDFNDTVFAAGSRKVGSALSRYGDIAVIDGLMVNGSAKAVGWFASVVRHLQTGYLYHYAFTMIIGLLAFLSWLILTR
jgi:NADH-quinone oxidoreductase subunit L